ncbi:MAG TPA: heme lyase CcmF/NrfE family subunit [Acidimicrobiia bacterium]|nr:heme lyase CcmF/NrfE family subunit [Acidimicrobiia bacterium]
MIAVLGQAGVVVALVSAVALAVQGLRSYLSGGVAAPATLRLPIWGLLGGAIVAMGALELALLTNDFSIEYVARNHARGTPLVFTIASAWAALEGSIVLWGLVLAGYTTWMFRRLNDDDPIGAAALAVMGAVAIFFFGLMATAANPFSTLAVAPPDGFGANPLLQNHILMAIHPPMLYLGYVGLTVPFAFAIAALAAGDGTTAWLERTRRWALIAWSFLTLGIVLGAWWSYEVLGWGGYWAWDPVENASFLPWLTATAFIHSAVVQRRRGMLQAWNVALVIGTFALTILGTFLTRSGVVASVHSFTQSAVGPALLGFLLVILVGGFGLFAARGHLVSSTPRLDSLASREGVFLLNNLLLALFAFVVLLGTIYPLILEAISGDRVSVGPPWFDRTAIPIGLVLLFAMGIGPVTPYRAARAGVLWERLRGPLQAAAVTSAALVLVGMRSITPLLTVALATLLVSAIFRQAHVTARARPEGYLRALGGLFGSDPGYWGGMVAHTGVALVAVAIAFSGSFDSRAEITLAPGASASFDGYTITYVEPFGYEEPHRTVIGAEFTLSRGGDRIATLSPRLNQYENQVQAIPTPAVHTGIREDIYLSLVRIEPGSTDVTIDALRFPLMWMLWLGGLIVVSGGLWSFAARRRTRTLAPEAAGV